jgi:hypothetical protein
MDFLDCCYGFLGNDLAKKSTSKRKRKRSHSSDQEELECVYYKPDFSKCQQVTPIITNGLPKTRCQILMKKKIAC